MDIEALIARGIQVLLALGGAYLIATWFVLAIWTFRDIESRSRSVVTQVFSTLLVVLFWVPGLLLYWLLRPKETLDEAYQRSLEEEYLLQDLEEMPLCPTCHHYIEDEWQICPHCNTQLRDSCENCGHLIDLRWDICPYCGADHHGHAHDHDHDHDHEGEQWVDPALIEERLRSEEARRLREATKALPAVTAESADDHRDVLGSFRRLDVLRSRTSSNGHAHSHDDHDHEHDDHDHAETDTTSVTPRASASTEASTTPDAPDEDSSFELDLETIAASPEDDREPVEGDKVPERFKVR